MSFSRKIWMGGKKLLSRSSKSIDKSSKVSEWGWQSKCSWLFGSGRQYPCNQEQILQKRMSQLATYRGGGANGYLSSYCQRVEAPGLLTLARSGQPEIAIPNTRRYQELVNHTGRERRGHKGDGGTNDRQTPQGMTGTWA